MTRRTYLSGIALLGAVVLASAGLVAQEKSALQEMSPQEQAMMEAWMKYMTPGEAHGHLAQRAGEWDLQVKIWHDPSLPAEESTATSKIKVIMGGRYLLEKVEGEFQGEAFHGLGIGGFDNLKQKYVGCWIDNLGTGIMYYEGVPSGDHKTIDYVSDHPDLLTGTYKKTRSVEKMINEDTYHMAGFNTTPDGKEYKHMELTYTRKK
ncbi:MAG: DUF1579 domain-containing protein [Planctomycetota bacterium]|jgi:hypothetical protein